MSPYYRRKEPGLKENLEAGMLAAGLAAGIGAVTFYLVRLLLSREALEPLPPPAVKGELPPSDSGKPDQG